MIRQRTETLPGLDRVAERRFATLHLVQSSRLAQRVANWLLIGMALSIVGMLALPWQQTSRGTGQVVAYVPQERQQTVEAPIKGVVAKIADGLVEGSKVSKGDFLVELQPFAENLVAQLEAQKRELEIQLESANNVVAAYEQNVEGNIQALNFGVQAAQLMVEAAQDELDSERERVAGYRSKEWQARVNYERQNRLLDKGFKPAKEVEKLKKEWEVTKAELAGIEEKVQSLEKKRDAKKDELEEKRQLGQTKVDYARAMLQDSIGKASKIRKEMQELQTKLDETSRFRMTAPKDGTIFRMDVYELGQSVKPGDPILTIVPDAAQKAVELSIPGNDMPLVQLGQEVRLQFEGWPAVQFAGWPSVAIGTFSGQVSTVDPTDNGKGQFRILVTPNLNDDSWPSDRYLRQGVRANGWVMLKRVPLGYEIWRQLNGFPVILSPEEPGKKSDAKPPKLPK